MITALILAGGAGTRVGGNIPKQYMEVKGRPIIAYCIDTFKCHNLIDNIQIVADKEWTEYILNFISADKFRGFSNPGKTRQLSVYNGLCDIKKYSSDDDIVIIHDAARPLVKESMITECIEKAKECDGVLPVLSMKDTVYMSDDGERIASLLERKKIFAGQAPEAFKLGKYYDANVSLIPDKILSINGSTEPAIMAGLDIAMINGDEDNFKITTKNDFEKFVHIAEMSGI